MISPVPQPALPGAQTPPNRFGLYLVPPSNRVAKVEEADCFDDEEIAPVSTVEAPKWYEPHMIVSNMPDWDFHDYQRSAISEILNAFLIEDIQTVRLIMPTGTGKTILFNGLAKMLAAMDYRVLILVHRKDLLRQATEKLAMIGVMPLVEQGDERALARFGGNNRIVVASVQSLHRERVRLWPRDSFDFVISDEAHHVRADHKNHWWKVSKWFKAKHLGVTATPGVTKKINGKRRYVNIPGWQRDVEPIKLLEAIEAGWLSRLVFKKVDTDIDLTAVGRVFGEDSDFNQNELDSVIYKNTNKLATAIKENIENRPTIIFTPLVASAEGLAAALNDIGIKSKAVSASTPDRLEIYKAHERGEFQAIVNCMVCTEGFDAPYIEAVVIARPTQSINVYRQIVGRGTRTSPKTGKKSCLIVDFAFVTGNLPLAGPAEMLREKLINETEEEIEAILDAAQDILDGDEDAELMDVLEQAKKTVEEQKEADRVKQEIAAREAAEREARRLKNREERFRYEVTTLDPLSTNLLGIPERTALSWTSTEPPTEPQKDFIRKVTKGKIDVETLSKQSASSVIAQIKSDMAAGLSTYGQRDVLTRRLGKNNISTEQARAMTKDEASAYISEHKTW